MTIAVFGRFAFGFQNQFVEFAEQADRKIIDAKKTTILEGPEKGSLSRAAQAGDDDERRRLHVGNGNELIGGQRIEIPAEF